jgi:acetyltransferase-like isoleucine patch superfamily enzyme
MNSKASIEPFGELSAEPLSRTSKGQILLIALVVVVILLGVAFAFINLSISQNRQTIQSAQSSGSEQIAKAGLDMVRMVLLNGYSNKWNDELLSSVNNQAIYNPADAPINAGTNPALFQWARDIRYDNGRYWAIVTDNNDGDGNLMADIDDKVQVRIRGFIPSANTSGTNVESIISAILRYRPPVYTPDVAITSGGSLKLFGNATVSGTNGTIYANDNVEVAGSAFVLQDVYSTGNITAGGGNIGGTSYPGSMPAEIPSISPSAYASLADYILEQDGKVYDKDNVLMGDASISQVLGWDFSGGEWKYNSSNNNNGTFYVTNGVDVDISGSPGSTASPWEITLLATGDVKISGSPVMKPDSPGVCILAEKDLTISGNLTVKDGLVATHEQMSITGSVDITGVIVAEDAVNTADSSITPTGKAIDVNISGSATITYNGGLTTFLDLGDPAVVVLALKKEK